MARFLEFHGIFPRITEDNLPTNSATVANDVNLRSGRLEPWRERLALAEAPESALTMHQHGCCYYTWDTCVSVAEYLPDYNSLFLTGRRGYPERAVFGDNCSLTYYRLGVPKPAGTPSVSSASENAIGRSEVNDQRTMTGRSYCVTYVNIFGEESAPGNPSRVISVCDGDTVVITGLPPAPSSEYGVRYLRLYRSASVMNSDSGGTKRAAENDTPASWFMIAELPVGTESYADSTKELDLGWALQTDDYREPPADLRQITYLRGTGVLAGVTTNMVHFSEPYQPWNWMRKSDLTLPYNIVHAVSFGTYLYVTTTAPMHQHFIPFYSRKAFQEVGERLWLFHDFTSYFYDCQFFHTYNLENKRNRDFDKCGPLTRKNLLLLLILQQVANLSKQQLLL